LSSPEFTPKKIANIRKVDKDFEKKLNLNSSVVLHEYESKKRGKNLETAKSYIALA
jgi:hypothetical protein